MKKGYFERKIDPVLPAWANEGDRKPLLLWGVRKYAANKHNNFKL
jgi:hypothetical protein